MRRSPVALSSEGGHHDARLALDLVRLRFDRRQRAAAARSRQLLDRDADPGEDPSQARKYFSLSEKYAAFRDFRIDPKGFGLHGMTIPPGEVVRLTEAEVLAHPLYNGFGPLADDHPPMRGWLATSVCGDGGRAYGLLQLSDKRGGRDFDEADETNIHELAALIGEALDALRLAAQQPA
jgi:GAF domain-containing protein